MLLTNVEIQMFGTRFESTDYGLIDQNNNFTNIVSHECLDCLMNCLSVDEMSRLIKRLEVLQKKGSVGD